MEKSPGDFKVFFFAAANMVWPHLYTAVPQVKSRRSHHHTRHGEDLALVLLVAPSVRVDLQNNFAAELDDILI